MRRMHVQHELHFKGMPHRVIAGHLGISESMFSKMCRGKAAFPLKLVKPLATLIGATVDDIITAFNKVRNTHE